MIKRMTDRELARFFANKKIATMQELKHALVTEVDMTVYRALKRLSYRTSYSHGGRYYALNRTIKFGDESLAKTGCGPRTRCGFRAVGHWRRHWSGGSLRRSLATLLMNSKGNCM